MEGSKLRRRPHDARCLPSAFRSSIIPFLPFLMRGSPPLHLVLFVIGFALLAMPLAQLTFARPIAPRST